MDIGIPEKRGRVALPLRKARAIDDFGSRVLGWSLELIQTEAVSSKY